MVQEIFGVSPYIQARAADLAALGYVVLAPELYWRLPDRTIDESREDVLQQGMALAGQVDWDTTVSDTQEALHHLRAQPEVVGGAGLIGFCFGGGLAFSVAARDKPDVLVSYYGSALPGLLDLAEQVSAPSLHHFGLADAFIPLVEVQRIEAAVTKQPGVTFETYAGANHAFDNPQLSDLHHPEASQQAWRKTVAFLAERLPTAHLAA
jgi:carboxymethylenebutenolidase